VSIDTELNEQIASAASRFLPSRFPIKPTGPFPEREDLRAAWQELIALGWPFVLASEHGGTTGASQIDVIFRALGRNPIIGPTVDMFVGLPLVWRAADASIQTQLEPHLSGDRLLSCAHESEGADGQTLGDLWSGATMSQGRLTGVKTLVDSLDMIDDLLVFARADGEPVIAMVDGADSGIQADPLSTPDLSRRFALVRFDNVTATILVQGERAAEVGRAFQTFGRLATVAELAGISQAALEMTVDYAKLRKQFGRTIGSFQAIKHF
jgi:alkylation response protein AidB-like acyl-CoA dehydrogenase